jgi:phage I-like protein
MIRSNAILCSDGGSGFVFGNGVELVSSVEVPSEIEGIAEADYREYVHPGTGERKRLRVTAEDIDAAVAHFNRRRERNPSRDLLIDYEHKSFLSNDPSPAAGWIDGMYSKMRDGKKVLVLKVRSWTEKAKEFLHNKEYRYFSPVWAQDVLDKETGQKEKMIFNGGALTNEPFFDGLLPIVSHHKTNHEESTMKSVIARLIAIFNLAQDATEDVILAKLNDYHQLAQSQLSEVQTGLGLAKEFTIDQLKASVTVAKGATAMRSDMITALGLASNATNEEIKAKVLTLTTNATDLQKLSGEMATLKAGMFDGKFNEVIAKGISTGRITSAQKSDERWMAAQKAWAQTDFPSFESYFTTKAPQIVPLDRIEVDNKPAVDDPLVIAKAAQDYIATEAKAGRTVSYTQAVHHVTQKKGVQA